MGQRYIRQGKPRHYLIGRIISRFGDVPWPPRSPDLLISFFGDTLKRKILLKTAH